MDECLREVAAKLTLANVEFLCEDPRRATGSTVAFEPAERPHHVSLVPVRQRHRESAQHERAFGTAECLTVLGCEAVDVSVLGQGVADGVQCGPRAGVVSRQRSTDGGEEQSGVCAGVAWAAQPTAVRSEAPV